MHVVRDESVRDANGELELVLKSEGRDSTENQANDEDRDPDADIAEFSGWIDWVRHRRRWRFQARLAACIEEAG